MPKSPEQLWSDPANWRWGIYYCKEDPRVVVPKSIKWMGWTVNFARPSAVPIILLIGLLAVAPMLWMTQHGIKSGIIYWSVAAVDVALICLICSWMSSTKRFQNRP